MEFGHDVRFNARHELPPFAATNHARPFDLLYREHRCMSNLRDWLTVPRIALKGEQTWGIFP